MGGGKYGRSERGRYGRSEGGYGRSEGDVGGVREVWEE